MSAETKTPPSPEARFADELVGAFDQVMDRFYGVVLQRAEHQGLGEGEVYAALEHGYGDVVAEGWREWMDES